MARRAPALALIAAAQLAAAGAVPAGAAEPWAEPATVHVARGGEVADPAVAVDERGTAVAAAVHRTPGGMRLLGLRRTARRGFGDAFVLQRRVRHLERPTVEFDGRGRALVAYRRTDAGRERIAATSVGPRGARAVPTVFTGPIAAPSAPRFADPPFERPLLVWRDAGDAYATRVEPDGSYDRTARFALGRASIGDIAVAAEPRGGSIAVFVRRDAAGREQVLAARRRPAGATYTLTPVSPIGRPQQVSVAVTRTGRAVVTWSDGSRWFAAIRPRGAARFGSARPLDLEAAAPLRLTATGDDRVALTWTTPEGALFTRRLDGPPRRLSRPGHPVGDVEVRGDGAGGYTVAFVEPVGEEPAGIVRVVAITARGAVGRLQRLSAAGERAADVALAVGARGDALATWAAADGTRLRAARRPA